MEHKTKEEIIELAHQEELEVVELTQGRNGYPAGLGGHAIIGFFYGHDIQRFMDTIGYFGSLHYFHSRNGWHFYEDAGWSSQLEFTLDEYMNKLGENYEVMTTERLEEMIQNRIDNFNIQNDDLGNLIVDLNEYNYALDDIEARPEVNFIYHDGVEYDEFVPSPKMQHDTHIYAIGLILPANYNELIK